MNKEKNIQIANDTLKIIERGFYKNSKGEKIDFKQDLEKAIKESILYSPDEVFCNKEEPKYDTKIEFTLESTLQAGKRLLGEGFSDVVCLNFASAKNPGGGFLRGTIAQEESLARTSGLYPCINQMQEMYEHNKNLNGLYSDYMVYSPKVPVFKDDNGVILNNYHLLSFITSPAVNVNSINKSDINKINQVMQKRIDKIIDMSIYHKQEVVVLGAFGCGIFKNNPYDIAESFKKSLERDNVKQNFRKIVFAIIDKNILDIFKKVIY